MTQEYINIFTKFFVLLVLFLLIGLPINDLISFYLLLFFIPVIIFNKIVKEYKLYYLFLLIILFTFFKFLIPTVKIHEGHNLVILNENSNDFYKKNLPKEIFDFFDQINHKNVYKIYPHKLFCNTKIKNKCIFHSKNTMFFFDKFHPSYSGSDLINQLIFDKINKIENKN